MNIDLGIIKSLIMQILPDKDTVLDIDTDLFNNTILDSLGIVELIVVLEKEFDIKFSTEELVMDNFKSIESIFNLVSSKETL